MKKISAMLMALVMALSMAACAPSTPSNNSSKPASDKPGSTSTAAPTGKKEVLEFYHGYFHEKSAWAPAAVMRDIYDQFAKEYATGDVEFKQIPVENHPDLVASKVSGGTFPDMVDMAGTTLPQAAISQNLIYDLKPFIDSENIKDAVGINYEQNQIDGKIYSVHDQLVTIGYWYNEKIFKDAGAAMPDTWKTWDDYGKSMKSIKDYGKDKGIYAYGSGQGSTRMLNAMLALSEEGRKMLSGPLTADGVNSKVFADAFKAVATIDQANGSQNAATDAKDFTADFNEQKSGVFINGVWAAGAFSGETNFQPAIYPGNVSLSSAGSGITVAAGMSEAKTKLAEQFVKYMTSEEVQKRILTEVGANPCNTKVDIQALANASTDATTKLLAKACAQANGASIIVNTIDSVWGNDVDVILNTKLQECSVVGADIDSKLKDLQKEIVAIIS